MRSVYVKENLFFMIVSMISEMIEGLLVCDWMKKDHPFQEWPVY